MAPSYDDDFDFDDLDQPQAKKKPDTKAKKPKANSYDDEFFDIDEEIGSNKKTNAPKDDSKSVLPSINSRHSGQSKPQRQGSSKGKNKYNPYADKDFGGQPSNNSMEDYYEQLLDDQNQEEKMTSHPKVAEPLKKNQEKKVQQDNYEDEFYGEDNFEEQPIKEEPLKPKKQAQLKLAEASKPKKQADEQEYGDEFDEEPEYGDDDFEEADSPVKPSKKSDAIAKNYAGSSKPKTNNLTVNSDSKKELLPPKQISKKANNANVKPTSHKNINKIESRSVNKRLERSDSRHSVKSQDSKRGLGGLGRSRVSNRNDSEFIANRHYDMVEKSFPYSEEKMMKLKPLEINKMNDRMRTMIKKFNDELNDLITKNMLLLKNKAQEKHQTVEDRVRELEIQKKSGDTAIEVMEKEFGKLQGRQGELKEEEYQLVLEKRIEEHMAKIKEVSKEIPLIKRQVDTKGKKLSVKEVEQREAQLIHHLKTTLIATKKEDAKGNERIERLDASHEELQTKVADIEYKLDELIGEAKEKGINIDNYDQLEKKAEGLRKKLENTKNYNCKTENLISTKVDIVQHENEQIRISIRNVNSQINNLYGSIDHSQSEAIKIIEKAKDKSSISPIFTEGLDKLLKQIQESKANNEYFEPARSEVKSRRSESSRHKPLKNSDTDNIEKSTPLRSAQSQNKTHDEDGKSIKPKFYKKKASAHQEDEGGMEKNRSQVQQDRAWLENENEQNKRSSEPEPVSQKAFEAPVEDKKDKSKPFMLKKNKADSLTKPVQGTPAEPSVPYQTEPKQEEEDKPISIAPRMMKFGRKKNQEEGSRNDISVGSNQNEQPSSDKAGLKLQLQLQNNKTAETKPVEEDKPLFAPKRFNMRNRASERKEQSYMPSAQVKENPKQGKHPERKEPEEYKPKFDFKNQEPIFTAKEENKPSIPEAKIAEEPQVKPKFNLRLRDRMKKQEVDNQEGGYMPNNNAKSINDVDSYKEPQKEVTNSYAPKKLNLGGANRQSSVANPYAPKQQPANPYAPKQEITNPYAPKQQVSNPYVPKEEISNPYAPKQEASNPYAPKQESSNPYAPTTTEAPKRQRGLLKKRKPSASGLPKEKGNIYDQVEDLTKDVNEFGVSSPKKQNLYSPPTLKQEEPDLSSMLGINKNKQNKSDFDDLIGEVGVGKKAKKKNNDFFNDLQL